MSRTRELAAGGRAVEVQPSSALRDTLPGMVSPELARLVCRVDEQDETVRAVSDTVLDIKETVDQHTETLAGIEERQAQHGDLLAQHGDLLAGIEERQAQHGDLLAQHGDLLAEILRRLSTGAAD